MSVVDQSVTRNEELRAELREVCLKECGVVVPSIRQAMQAIAKNPADAVKVQELYKQVHALSGNATVSRLLTVARVVNALDV